MVVHIGRDGGGGGVNPGLGAKCWWHSKNSRRRASKTAGGDTYCRFGNTGETKKNRRRQRSTAESWEESLPLSRPACLTSPSTFDIYIVISPKEHPPAIRRNSPFAAAILYFRSPENITSALQIEYYSTSCHPFVQIPLFPV